MPARSGIADTTLITRTQPARKPVATLATIYFVLERYARRCGHLVFVRAQGDPGREQK